MVGLSDLSCVRMAVEKISCATVEAGVRDLRYFICCDSLVNNLSSEIDKVMSMEQSVARKVVEGRAEGKNIANEVLNWQEQVEDIKARAYDLLIQRTSSSTFLKDLQFSNPVSRFQLGRKAANLAKDVAELTVFGEDLMKTGIRHDPTDEIMPIFVSGYQKFGFKEDAYGKLWEQVKEDGHPIIGIYGMPVVGKTLVMEEACIEAKHSKIFNNFTRATVGTVVDVINIQNQLAEHLDCHLESEDNQVSRASQLKNCLMNRGKTLIMLDDVWDLIPFNNIGIPFGGGCSSNSFKIIMTSRNKHVCLLNHCKDPIEIKTLTDDEAYKMFQKIVGANKIQSLQDPDLAKKVCKECAGLPLVIQAVGRAIKFGDENSWRDALYKLENGAFKEIDGIDRHVHAYFQTGFEKLTDAEKTCLFLCALSPQNAKIEIKMLVDSATVFQQLHYKGDISRYFDILNSLLLNCVEDEGILKMNGFIRGVARSAAANDPKYAFLYIRCSRSVWPNNVNCTSRRLLHIELEVDDVCFPEKLVCPDLHSLWLQGNHHKQKHLSGFLKTFTNISFMFIKDLSLVEHQLPIHTLDKLKVLILDGCDVDEAFLNSIPDNLETLTIWNYNLPTRLYLPNLKSLKKLEISAGRSTISN